MITRLIWDEWNIAHIARHNVIPNEVEELIQGIYITKEAYDGRLMLLGLTKAKRPLQVIVQSRGSEGHYVVTAHTANRTYRRIYQEEIEEGGEQAA